MSDTSSTTDWTRDANGEFVDWTKAPHYVNGKLDLVLPGEDRGKMSRETFSKRNAEYTKLAKRKLRTTSPG